VERQGVASRADWFVRSYDDLMKSLKRYKVRKETGCLVYMLTCARGTSHFDSAFRVREQPRLLILLEYFNM
jgi:hypothetical protein